MDAPTKEEKVALLLLGLGPEAAERVLVQFEPEQQDFLRARLLRHKNSSPPLETFDQVLREFDELLIQATMKTEAAKSSSSEAGRGVRPGSLVDATDEDGRFSGPAEDPALNAQPVPSETDVARNPFAALAQLTHEQIAAALQGESARTASMVISCLSPEQVVAVLKILPQKMRCEIMVHSGLRMSDDSELVPRIVRAVLQKVRAYSNMPAMNSTDDARLTKTADVLRMLEETDRTQIMTSIAQHDSKVAAMIREYLYYFDDIIYIEDRSLQKILSGLDAQQMATALKGASQAIIEKVMQNVSARVQEVLSEEMELLGAVPSQQVEKARSQIVDVIQRLDQAGELVTTRKRGGGSGGRK